MVCKALRELAPAFLSLHFLPFFLSLQPCLPHSIHWLSGPCVALRAFRCWPSGPQCSPCRSLGGQLLPSSWSPICVSPSQVLSPPPSLLLPSLYPSLSHSFKPREMLLFTFSLPHTWKHPKRESVCVCLPHTRRSAWH